MIRVWLRRLRHMAHRRSTPAGAAPATAQPDPRLEIYLHQIADLPEPDRAIIIRVLQDILNEETAYERRMIAE